MCYSGQGAIAVCYENYREGARLLYIRATDYNEWDDLGRSHRLYD